jgi:hypothetical protein
LRSSIFYWTKNGRHTDVIPGGASVPRLIFACSFVVPVALLQPQTALERQMTTGLQTPKEFLLQVVDPDMTAFAGQVELRLAYHACISLFTPRDWVYETHKGNVWTFQTRSFPAISGKTRFLTDLCSLESDFEIIADIAKLFKACGSG